MSVDLIHEDYSGFFPWVMPKYADEVAYSTSLPNGVNTGGPLIKLPLATLVKLYWLAKQVTLSVSINYRVNTPDPLLYTLGTLEASNVLMVSKPPLPQQRTLPGGVRIFSGYEGVSNTGIFFPDQIGFEDGFPYTLVFNVDVEFFGPLTLLTPNLLNPPSFNPSKLSSPPYGNVCINDTVSPPDYYARFPCRVYPIGFIGGGANLFRTAGTDPSAVGYVDNYFTSVPMTGPDFLGTLNFHLQMDGVDLVDPSSLALYSLTPSVLPPGAITSTINGDLFVNFADFWS